MRTRFVSFLITLTAVGCGSSKSASTALHDSPASSASAPTTVNSSSVAIAADASTAPSAGAQSPSSSVVGMTLLAPIPESAEKINDDAFALHRKKNYRDAADGFARAVAAAPGYVLARYNLACAKSRLGDFAGARAALEEVFREDLAGLRAQADADDDLADFWKSPDGAATRAFMASIEPVYSASISRGIRALYWLPGIPKKNPPPIYRAFAIIRERPSVVRAGVFDSDTHAFITTTARQAQSITAFVDRELPYSIVVSGTIPEIMGGDLAPLSSVTRMSTYAFDVTGAPLATKTTSTKQSPTLHIDGDNATLLIFDPDTQPSPDGKTYMYENVTFLAGKSLKSAKTSEFPSHAKPHGLDVMMTLPSAAGFSITRTSGALALKNTTLTFSDGTKMELPKERIVAKAEASLVESKDQSQVIITFASHRCSEQSCTDSPTAGAHRILRVDRRTKSVDVLAEGTGVGAASFDDANHLFIQRDRIVERVTDAGREKLPDGILLVPPVLDEKDVTCCGFPP